MNKTSRVSLTLLGAVALLPLAAAEEEGASTAAIYACAETEDDIARLACFDAAVGTLRAAEEAGEITTVTREEVEEVQRDMFGLSFASLPSLTLPRLGGGVGDDGRLDTITAAVSRIERNAFDKAVVTLDNGQVWQQTENGMFSIRGVEEAEISRAAMGSFMMKLDGGRSFRVKRIN